MLATQVARIGRSMWARGRTELGLLGISPDSWRDYWNRRMQEELAFAITPDAILGLEFEKPGVVCSAFHASELFDTDPAVARAVSKALRAAIPRLMREVGFVESRTYSLCVDPRAARWFRFLGLVEDKNYVGDVRGPYTMRLFVRRG